MRRQSHKQPLDFLKERDGSPGDLAANIRPEEEHTSRVGVLIHPATSSQDRFLQFEESGP